ncbi:MULTISPECIES: DUF6160 family protein [Acinetobacter]|uniref:DUF6160 domain-containing protein n=2 Tax=Acinetobacter TaxID=469 RepID=A0A4Q7B2P6_9GAMM|nr:MULTISPECIES: DUF6160 family protein [Acinetobacter]MCW8037661.1 hypothetical protein [Acinetobacter entericus]RZG68825.1 hypothetical protein EXE25_03915 [Acinetobacter bouvetii]TCB75777.1 hypothetical protein E0H91_05150 [Acinetobacter sp. ANC 4177]
MRKITKLKLLTVCILAAQQANAFEQLSDESLSSVRGQDGISISQEVSKVTINQANWVDQTANGSMKLGLHNVTIQGENNQNIISKLNLDVGTTPNGAGVHLNASISPFQATIANLMLICSNAACKTTQQSLGSLNISTSSPLVLNLITTNGLFNRNALAHMDLEIKNADISYGLNSKYLTLNDFNFNISADGYLYIDRDEGIVLTTKAADGTDHIVNLGRVADNSYASGRVNATNPGVNIDLRYGSDLQNQKNVIRLGASGALTKGRIQINANQADLAAFNTVNHSAGSSMIEQATTAQGYETDKGGLHLGMSAEFTRAKNSLLSSTQAPTTFELGHTGRGSYAIEFSNLSPLVVPSASDEAGNTHNAYIDFGDIYINALQAKTLNFIINDNIQKTLGASSPIFNYYLDPQTNSSLSQERDVAFIAVRGMDFQAIARTAKFISDNSQAELGQSTATWGLGIPIFNLNANLALFSKTYSYGDATVKQGLGYNLVFSTEGYGIDKKTNAPSTTSIIIVDGAKGVHDVERNYYAGLRNIDAFMKADGVIGFEDDGIYVKADNLLFAAKAEVAIGQLPGSVYNCAGVSAVTNCGTLVPADNFSKKDDVLSSIAFKIDGKGELFIIPGMDAANSTPDTNFLSFKANFAFNDLDSATAANQTALGSYISVMNEDVKSDGSVVASSVNLNKLQGNLGLDARLYVKSDQVVLDNQIQFNYPSQKLTSAQIQAGQYGSAFRAEIALAPSGSIQKIADIVIPGGNMRSTLGITPR